MSTAAERERVVLALAGRRAPVVGEMGVFWIGAKYSSLKAEVRVERVSPTGKTLWLRFMANAWELRGLHRVRRGKWGTDWFPYGPVPAPYSVVTFPRDR